MADSKAHDGKMKIYRAADAPGLVEAQCMPLAPMSESQSQGLMRLVEAGYIEGDEIKVLVDLPGFALTHAWLKKEYPLMRHSHDSDCMYYIVAGTLKLGTQELGPMDCFFVPADVPYTYVPGPEGVEVLEIRHETRFNFVNLVNSAGWWEKAEAICAANRQEWRDAKRPPREPVG